MKVSARLIYIFHHSLRAFVNLTQLYFKQNYFAKTLVENARRLQKLLKFRFLAQIFITFSVHRSFLSSFIQHDMEKETLETFFQIKYVWKFGLNLDHFGVERSNQEDIFGLNYKVVYLKILCTKIFRSLCKSLVKPMKNFFHQKVTRLGPKKASPWPNLNQKVSTFNFT